MTEDNQIELIVPVHSRRNRHTPIATPTPIVSPIDTPIITITESLDSSSVIAVLTVDLQPRTEEIDLNNT